MRLRTAALFAVATGTAVWWRRRRRRPAPPALQLGLADGSTHALAEADAPDLLALAAEVRHASLVDG